ncbi:MAG: NAD-dependent epimerase/dehydratase family protein, partial [Elusimicrobiota bacterium]|nr:NAD-dependent epimerase/dehydratase family protein [Elusimicrobiota bacterium]
MQKIIIFGATGETGPYVADYAKKYLKNFEIIAVGRKKTDFFEKRGIKYHCVDIANADDFKVLPNKDIYAAMLIAAVIPRGMQKYDPKAYIDSNIIGAFNVLEYLRKTGADRIIYTQT